MNKIWIDPDLLENNSGIGRDSKLMIQWLNNNFDTEIVTWPQQINRYPKFRRKFLLGMRMIFGKSCNLPNAYKGAFYQTQLGPLLPGKEISLWIVRLHDLFPVTNPEWFRWWATKIFKKSLSMAVNQNAIFLCDSVSTESEIKRLYKSHKLNTYVIPCQLPPVNLSSCGLCEGCKGLEKAQSNEYFLSVGTIEPRKNYSFGLSAWRDFVTESNFVGNLIIVGRPGWKTHDTQKELRRAINEQVIWMSNCCDGALEKLYAGTQALISFSLAEGFDLPPMEARQRYQKSLILSDIPVHREFHEDYAVFFSNKLELIELLKNPRRSTEISKYFEHSVSNLNLVTSYLKSML